MASLFVPPKSLKSPKVVQQKPDALEAQAKINRDRRRGAGGFNSTILGSGLKGALGQ